MGAGRHYDTCALSPQSEWFKDRKAKIRQIFAQIENDFLYMNSYR